MAFVLTGRDANSSTVTMIRQCSNHHSIKPSTTSLYTRTSHKSRLHQTTFLTSSSSSWTQTSRKRRNRPGSNLSKVRPNLRKTSTARFSSIVSTWVSRSTKKSCACTKRNSRRELMLSRESTWARWDRSASNVEFSPQNSNTWTFIKDRHQDCNASRKSPKMSMMNTIITVMPRHMSSTLSRCARRCL